MVADTELTQAEARVLWTVLHNSYAPGQYFAEFKSAMDKLCRLGGGFACRDCSAEGTKSSRFGGFVCASHKTRENEMLLEQAFREAVTK